MTTKRVPFWLRAAVALTLPPLAGCATFHQVHALQSHAEARIAAAHLPKTPPVVRTVSTPYLLGSVVMVRPPVPAVLRQRIHLATSAPMTLAEIAGKITAITGVPVHVDIGNLESAPGFNGATLPPLPGQPGGALTFAGPSSAMPLHWNGSVAGLLDTVTARYRVYWKFRNGEVSIFRTETRTFSIPALDWVGNLHGSISSSSGGAVSTGGGAVGGAQGQSGSGDMSITNQSAVNVWKGMTHVVETVAGSGARVVVDPSLGNISVTATPPQLSRVARWVATVGRQMTRQVAVTIRVYNVKVNGEQNYGLSLAGAFNQVAKRYGISFSGMTPPAVASGETPMSFGAGILNATNPGNAQFNGSQVTVQALATLGNTTQAYSQSAVTLNGQPSPIQVARQITYLAESGTTLASNVGSTTQATPGMVTTGFTANILPRIEGDHILLGINMNLSDLLSITTIPAGTTSIEAPDVFTDAFFKSVDLKSGSTLVLNSYAERDGTTTNNGVGSPYMPLLGGGADATNARTMIVITITARIL